ncbi:cysteine proteinase EP-B 1-like [Eucalyptus grandis]|uniref:cysteine proteinase EP-B 1-like n=1 Tax=Eucalyptus grandis TaxID=71139 RepID=UPI00192E9108|nr:cysteine proteinase EP-B 1-like [Eucalyptus grandis]
MAFTFKSESSSSLALILGAWARQAMSVRMLREPTIAEQHQQWMAEYVRTYKDPQEKAKCQAIFGQNLRFIEDFKRILLGILSRSSSRRNRGDHKRYGCRGGYPDNAFKYIIRNQGIASQNTYAYHGMDRTCNATKAAEHTAQIKGFADVPPGEDELMKAVSQQPVAVIITASGREFQSYRHGVFNGDCGSQLDHVVVVVGYGKSEDGINFWKIRKSWGVAWGEGGYMRIQRGGGSSKGICGLASEASYPLLKDNT